MLLARIWTKSKSLGRNVSGDLEETGSLGGLDISCFSLGGRCPRCALLAFNFFASSSKSSGRNVLYGDKIQASIQPVMGLAYPPLFH